MRILRIAAVVFFIAALALNILGNAKYRAQQDVTPPVISGDKEVLELTVAQGMNGLKQGLTATDKEDGDLTDKIIVSSTGYFVEKGTINVNYVVFDKGHNCGKFSRKVRFTDYESPRFSLLQPLVVPLNSNVRPLSYITATDSLDGDVTGNITVVSGQVSNYSANVYPVVVEVSNSYGDRVRVPFNVEVRSPKDVGPEIILSSYIIYIKKGTTFDPKSMVLSVRAQTTGEELDKENVFVPDNVYTDIPGCYPIRYVYDHDGKEGRAYLTVVVEE